MLYEVITMDIIEHKKGISCHKPTEAISSPVLLLKSVSDTYTDQRLISYLRSRNIPSWAYEQYTKQVEYYFRDTPDKVYTAVGFQNDSGGWEMRNSIHKYAISPKDVTTFGGGYDEFNIMEGFFDMMSLLVYHNTTQLKGTTCVLNGLGLSYNFV